MRQTNNMADPPPNRGIPPVQEAVEDDWNPYRGYEMHGVEQTADPVEIPGYDGTVPVEYEKSEPEPKPTPVRIVNEGSRERRAFRVNRAYSNGTPALIVRQYDRRSSVQIRNLSATKRVFIGPDPTVTNWTGFPVEANGTFSTNAETAVYAVTEDETTVELAIYTEYTVEL